MEKDLDVIRSLMQEDASLVENLLTAYRAQIPDFLKEFDKSVQEKAFMDLKIQAHTLKGVCLNLGFSHVGGALKNLENATLTENSANCMSQLSVVREELHRLDKTLRNAGF